MKQTYDCYNEYWRLFNLDSKLIQVNIIWKFVQVLCYTEATILKIVESVKSFLKQKYQIFARSMWEICFIEISSDRKSSGLFIRQKKQFEDATGKWHLLFLFTICQFTTFDRINDPSFIEMMKIIAILISNVSCSPRRDFQMHLTHASLITSIEYLLYLLINIHTSLPALVDNAPHHVFLTHLNIN